MNKDYLVTKSNFFIMNSSYDLSLQEQKIILTLASMVQPLDEEFKPYKFKINDFMKLLDVDTKTKYTEVPKITKNLMKKVFEIRQGKKILQVAWLSSAEYEEGSGYVELEFSPKLKPFMLKLNSMFTQYRLENILSMKSKYSPRIYEFLKCNEFKQQGYMQIEVEELRKLLKAENIYPRYNDFKRKIIMQTQKELRKKTDISFDFKEIKTGRKITSLKFYIKSNNEVAATKSDEEAPKQKNYIKVVKKIVVKPEITSLEAKKIYDSARGDLKQIQKVYDYFQNKHVENFIGTLISMVKPGAFQKPKSNVPVDDFNSYGQRQYNFNDLEKRLLGWQNEED